MPKRTVEQIAASRLDDRLRASLFALCNDGTVWLLSTDSGALCWKRIIDVPQGDGTELTI